MIHFKMNEGEILTDMSCFIVSVPNSTWEEEGRGMLYIKVVKFLSFL